MNDKREIITAIADSELFGALNHEVIEAIADIAYQIIMPPDTVVYQPGNEASTSCCYVVKSGMVGLFLLSGTKKGQELLQLGPGKSFREAALLTDEPVLVSLKTLEETQLIVIPREPFVPIMNKHPEVAAVIGKRVSQWLSTAGNLIESRIDSQRESLHEMNRLKCVDFVLIIGLSIVCALVFNLSNPKGIPLFPKSFSDEAISGIKPSEALEEQREGKAILIDARPYESFEQEHMAGALSLPLSVFDFMYDLNLGRIDKSKKIIIYGRTISKRYDEEVARKLVARGHKNVKILKEDVRFWKKKDYPVEP